MENISLGRQMPILQSLYSRFNKNIEKFSQILDWIIFKMGIPVGALPPIFSTMVNYFIFDMGNNSFILPCPMLYVRSLKKL